ncbi:hypothetical protein [Epilithonimonas sp.]|uniref:hypothetical protein n=1 Tax=Epilithonimonas sp. TaxID=2894511 RepID=UPI0028A1B045|nr:hypothetical protein [Epilithonimonas sp.]
MKNIFILLSISIATCVHSQVAIGKDNVTNNSVSLEFGSANKGLLLPWVTSTASVAGAVDGTIIYDLIEKKVKYLKDGNWFDLSVDNTGKVINNVQDALSENPSAKVVIGSDGISNPTPGILVLSDTDKAMVLPKVESPHLNIINPAAGMIAYDTASRQLAVFNGTVWSFWKP